MQIWLQLPILLSIKIISQLIKPLTRAVQHSKTIGAKWQEPSKWAGAQTNNYCMQMHTLFPDRAAPVRSSLLINTSKPLGTPGTFHRRIGVGS